MNFDYPLYPKLIKKYHSKFNGELLVLKQGNSYRIDAGGLTQSGNIMAHVWSWGVGALIPRDFVPTKILMLGVAGGSAIKWLSKKYPKAQITGVDVDPVIVDIGREYFGLNRIKNLNIVISDAAEFLKANQEKFDIIFFDCYQGNNVPNDFENISLLSKAKKDTRYLLINRLYWGEYIIDSTAYEIRLRKYFNLETTASESNLIISLISEKSI